MNVVGILSRLPATPSSAARATAVAQPGRTQWVSTHAGARARGADPGAATEALDLALGAVDALDAELLARAPRTVTAPG